MNNEYVTEEGEVIQPGQQLQTIDNAALATLARVEIDHQIATARQYPRSIDRAMKNIIALATLDEETAESCCYALVRSSKRRGAAGGEDNKPIEGPSIRLAEIALTQWGNSRAQAHVVEVNRKEKYLAAEGVFHDLETNVAIKKTVRRRISTKAGALFSDDMITVTGNAACAIALRNAVLAGIPRGIYLKAYLKAREIIAGTAETLTANRTKAIGAFSRFGVTPEQIFEALEVEGEGDIKPSHIATLRAMFSTLKNGESSVEEMFGKGEPDHKVVENPLADEPAEDGAEAAAGADNASASTETGADGIQASAAPVEAAAGEGIGKPDPAAADPDPWFQAGQKAARDGMSRRAVPPELRSDDRAADLDRWRAGYDAEKGSTKG